MGLFDSSDERRQKMYEKVKQFADNIDQVEKQLKDKGVIGENDKIEGIYFRGHRVS